MFERQREGDFARRGSTGAAAGAGGQAALRLPLQWLGRLLRTQWTSALCTAANSPKRGFHFSLFQNELTSIPTLRHVVRYIRDHYPR